MTRKKIIFLSAFIVQIIVVLLILLFPERVKEEKYTNWTPLRLPRTTVVYPGIPPNDIRRCIAESNVFSRYTGTRGLAVSDTDCAVVIIADRKYEEYIHLDRYMIRLSDNHRASLIIDPREAPASVPITREDGSYRTTSERQELYFMEAIAYMKDVGYSHISLWTFGDWFDTALQLTRETEISGIIDSLVFISAGKVSRSGRDSTVPALFICGSEDDALGNIRQNLEARDKLLVLQGYNSQLLDLNGVLSAEDEWDMFQEAENWTLQSSGK